MQIAESTPFCHSERSEESKKVRHCERNLLRVAIHLVKKHKIYNIDACFATLANPCGLPRSHSLARNDENIADSAIRRI